MTTVKFDKSVKYEGVRYPAHVAFEVKDSDVPQLRKIGAIVLSVTPDESTENTVVETEVAVNETEEATKEENVDALKEELLTYSAAKLIQFAKDRNISLQGKTRKADIYNIIVSTL